MPMAVLRPFGQRRDAGRSQPLNALSRPPQTAAARHPHTTYRATWDSGMSLFLFVVLLLLAKFKRFKGFGFEAEMWEEKQEEAAALVKSLKRELDRFRTPREYLLKSKTDEITKKLTPFAGVEFDCAFASNSGEQANFWYDLQPALIAAGWKNVPWRYGESTGGHTQAGRPETGEVAVTNVEIHLHPEQRGKLASAASALISALNNVGIEARDMDFNAHNSNCTAIHILIGEKQMLETEDLKVVAGRPA